MPRKITYDIVLKEFVDRGYKLISKEYLGYTEKLQYICPIHEDRGIQEITFANFTKGKNCPYCSKRKKRTTEEYKQELKNICPNILCIEEYKGLKVKILHKCEICNYEWQAVPTNLLHLHQGCPKCSKRHYKRSQEEFEEEVLNIHPDIIVLGKFSKVATKIKFQCKNCENVWETKPNNILQGNGCPFCKASRGEQKISKWLKVNNIVFYTQYKFNDCRNKLPLPFDFYLPDSNTCIEYDGIQHYKPCRFGGITIEEAKNNLAQNLFKDKLKTDYCLNNNINLIRISYKDFNNIENILSSNFN